MHTQAKFALPDLPGIEPGWELIEMSEPAQRGRFTAEQLSHNEGRLQAILGAVAQGMSVRSIAKAYGVSTNTVLTAQRKFAGEIETLKQELGRSCMDVARLAVERMRDEMDDMPKASLPIIAGVMIDKGQLLTGAPTMRVQHDHTLTVASVADYIDSLPAASPVIAGGEIAQKAIDGVTPAGEHLGASELLEATEAQAVRDSQSLLSAQIKGQAPQAGADVGQIDPKKEGSS